MFDGVAPEVAKRYTVYTITFAGFDGAAPTQPPYIDAFTKSVEELIAQEKLVKPILVGHSLGGHIAVRIAEEIPNQIGGVMVLDMLPRFPPSPPNESPETRQKNAAAFRDEMLQAPPGEFAMGVHSFTARLVTDPNDVNTIATRSAKSDRATYAGAFYELEMADLRPNLSKITAPVEVVAPAKPESTIPQEIPFYTAAFAGVANLDVEPIAPSLHFMMYDQPAKFQALLDAFLAKVAG